MTIETKNVKSCGYRYTTRRRDLTWSHDRPCLHVQSIGTAFEELCPSLHETLTGCSQKIELRK